MRNSVSLVQNLPMCCWTLSLRSGDPLITKVTFYVFKHGWGEVGWGWGGGACAFDKTRWKLAPLEIFKRDWKAILQESRMYCALCWLVARLTFLCQVIFSSVVFSNISYHICYIWLDLVFPLKNPFQRIPVYPNREVFKKTSQDITHSNPPPHPFVFYFANCLNSCIYARNTPDQD